jgi:hypothetical protein
LQQQKQTVTIERVPSRTLALKGKFPDVPIALFVLFPRLKVSTENSGIRPQAAREVFGSRFYGTRSVELSVYKGGKNWL